MTNVDRGVCCNYPCVLGGYGEGLHMKTVRMFRGEYQDQREGNLVRQQGPLCCSSPQAVALNICIHTTVYSSQKK